MGGGVCSQRKFQVVESWGNVLLAPFPDDVQGVSPYRFESSDRLLEDSIPDQQLTFLVVQKV